MLGSVGKLELKARFFRGFADLTRLAILEYLEEGERTVSEIVEATGYTQSNVSNHLGCLRDCGLVKSRQEGRSVYYSIRDEKIVQLLRKADEVLADISEELFTCTRYNELIK